MHTNQPRRGVTMLMVLLLLSVMLIGGLALARITEVGTLAAGNNTFRDASLQASEVGVNTAFAEVRALANENADTGNWYWATAQPTDAATGLPAINWNNAPEVVVAGNYRVRYVVERMCDTAAVTDTLRQCLVKQSPQGESNRFGQEAPEPPNSRQFRITVRVLGPKDTQTWIQSLVTKG